MMDCSRRSLIAALGAGALATAGGLFAPCVAASRSTALRFILNWKYQGPHGWFFLAQDRGYFAKTGVAPVFDQGDGSAAAVPKVAAGAYDLGFGDINALIEFAALHPADAPVGVFMLYNNPPFAIAFKSSSAIRVPKDLEGKNLGAPANDGALKLFPMFCKHAGIDEAKVTVTVVQPALREQMLVAGKLDGIFGYQTTIRMGLKQLGTDPDTDVRWINYRDYGLDLYSNAIIASRRLVRDRPAAIKGFLWALNRGLKDGLKDPAAAVEAVRRREPLINVALEQDRLRSTLSEMNNPEIRQFGLGDVSDARLARSIQTIAQALAFTNSPKVRQIFVRDFLPPAAERLHSLP